MIFDLEVADLKHLNDIVSRLRVADVHRLERMIRVRRRR